MTTRINQPVRKTKGAPGFTKLRGRIIDKVDNRAANVVYLTCANGDRFAIEADVTSLGIPVLRLTPEERKKRA